MSYINTTKYPTVSQGVFSPNGIPGDSRDFVIDFPVYSAMNHSAIFPTPIGPVRVSADAKGLASLDFRARGKAGSENEKVFQSVGRALEDYFLCGKPLRRFPLGHLGGTPFRRRVWKALLNIPFGQTRTYGEIATALGSPNSARAVGAACGANPLPIFIPCHRVLAAGGKLGGFSGGLDVKKKLLALEGISFSA